MTTLFDAAPARGLLRDTDTEFRFGEAADEFALATSAACACPRPDLAVVAVRGADALTFLQAQLITNLSALAAGFGTLSAWCTPQGRVSFLFHLVPAEDGFRLLVPASESARLAQRLRMFVLRARVTIEELSAEHAVLGVAIPSGAPGPELTRPPGMRYALGAPADGVHALCIDASARYLVWGETRALTDWWARATLPAVGSAAWRLLDVTEGHADIAGGFANEFLPQQLNLDMLDVLAFDKGCYPGQEVIARLRYRGEVKARLLCGRAAGQLAEGVSLRAGERSAGRVLKAVAVAPDETRFLAVVELAVRDAVRADGAPGLALAFETPPYWRA
ncbi:MAG: folate-binding protein YgfZ [Gammaproteobacteria bacterium]